MQPSKGQTPWVSPVLLLCALRELRQSLVSAMHHDRRREAPRAMHMPANQDWSCWHLPVCGTCSPPPSSCVFARGPSAGPGASGTRCSCDHHTAQLAGTTSGVTSSHLATHLVGLSRESACSTTPENELKRCAQHSKAPYNAATYDIISAFFLSHPEASLSL